MKTVRKLTLVVIAILFFGVVNQLLAHESGNQKAYSIGMRVNYWRFPDRINQFHVSDPENNVTYETEGFGGNVFFTSRVSNNWLFEATIGFNASAAGESKAKGDCDDEHNDYEHGNVDVETIIPILVGFRYQLSSLRSQTALQPYLSAGAGPYWFGTINSVTQQTTDGDEIENVTTEWKGRRGGYLGAGFDCAVARWLAFNFDVKYHFIDFELENDHSDFQYGVGLQVMWGR